MIAPGVTPGTVPMHPVLKCFCSEGRIIENGEVRYMPPVHSCDYILERNNRLNVRRVDKSSAA